MEATNKYAVIMAGGIGSRFWPISKTSHPKQFLDILGTGKTLIQQTFERFEKICPKENIYIVTNESYRALVKEQLPGISDDQILGEPAAKNTAPCIAYACHKINQKNPDALIAVAPSDHIILNEQEFVKQIETALVTAAENDFLITLGIKPTRPDTGYGYIQFVDNSKTNGHYKVKTFTEKPNLEIAKTFIQSGDFLWNAGIFVWSAKSIIKAFANYLPELNTTFLEGAPHYNTPKESDFINLIYPQCNSISIDYGIMEKADNVHVFAADFGWSDLGTWGSLYTIIDKDYVGNAVVYPNNVMMYDSANCMINTKPEKLIVVEGLHDFIVVDTDEVLMICPKNKEQQIKEMVADVKSKKGDKYI
jgi:mannose-1-phosphate guanylyltransferase